jgi:hypothetical protein
MRKGGIFLPWLSCFDEPSGDCPDKKGHGFAIVDDLENLKTELNKYVAN